MRTHVFTSPEQRGNIFYWIIVWRIITTIRVINEIYSSGIDEILEALEKVILFLLLYHTASIICTVIIT